MFLSLCYYKCIALQKPKVTILPSRYPRWKPESPQAAENADHQHTNQGTTAKPDIKESKMYFPLPLKTMEQMIQSPTIFSIYISTCTLIVTFLIDYNIWLT